MNEKEFEKLIRKNREQVFIFACPCTIPISFAVHSWIVTNNKGKIKRWDCWHWKNRDKSSNGYLSLNVYDPTTWLTVFYTKSTSLKKLRWDSKLIVMVEGNLAKKIIGFTDKNFKKYPFRDRYHFFPGPNSNTFVQWIIDKFPESGLVLPWNAFGKNYKN